MSVYTVDYSVSYTAEKMVEVVGKRLVAYCVGLVLDFVADLENTGTENEYSHVQFQAD